MQPNPQKFVTAYRANFQLDNVEYTLKSESPTDLQRHIIKLCNPSEARFDASGSQRGQWIRADNEVIGSITEVQVPSHLTVMARQEQQKKAAERQAA